MLNTLENTHSVLLENGNKLHFKKHRRHGSWSVNFDKGGIPASLAGEWTNLRELKDKAYAYLENRPERNRTKPLAQQGDPKED